MRIPRLAALVLVSTIHANVASADCVSISVPKNIVEARGDKWIELTDLQHAFAVGLYVLNPLTPAGLPYGDHAAMAKSDDDASGMVFFLDGEKACSWMAVPKELISMINQIGEGVIRHEGVEN